MLPNKRVDWPAVRNEFYQVDQRLNDFIRQRELPYTATMRMAGKQKWLKQRRMIQEHAAMKTRGEHAIRLAGDWDRQERLWDELETICEEFIAIARKAKSVSEVKAMAEVLERALKNKKLLKGEPTEISATKNYHAHLVRFLEEDAKRDGPDGAATSKAA